MTRQATLQDPFDVVLYGQPIDGLTVRVRELADRRSTYAKSSGGGKSDKDGSRPRLARIHGFRHHDRRVRLSRAPILLVIGQGEPAEVGILAPPPSKTQKKKGTTDHRRKTMGRRRKCLNPECTYELSGRQRYYHSKRCAQYVYRNYPDLVPG